MKKEILWFTFMMVLNFTFLNGQSDSLILNNGNVIVGEVKELARGVLTIKTVYSDSDFKIEWNGVKEIYCQSFFAILLSNRKRYNGQLRTSSIQKINIIEKQDSIEVDLLDIVFLKSINPGFWDRINASIALGYSFTKANNLSQFSSRSSLGYQAKKWDLSFAFSSIISTQDEVDDIRRTEGSGNFRYILQHGWCPITSITFLSNTEQKLNLRTNVKIGVGNSIIQNNKAYWFLVGGGSLNFEDFSSADPNQESFEMFFGTELNLFDIGDLNILTNGNIYSSITKSGRWRADWAFDLKYNLPLDLFIKMGFTYNFDNMPADGASEIDYVYQFTFGWEL